jgi:D-serine deaminase-like pyridoxal phosphate-dependent protein
MQLKITEPTLLLDKTKVMPNIEKMLTKSRQNQLVFRPHFKTHQSIEIASWYKDLGVSKCTVSSLKMAQYFAENGWIDITVAFPTNILEMDKIQRLASSINLNLLVESVDVVDILAKELKDSVSIFIKIDAGYNRTGIKAENSIAIRQLVHHIKQYSNLEFEGLLIHDGHTYAARGKEEIRSIYNTTLGKINKLRENLVEELADATISLGDTPTFSVIDIFEGFHEMRPGNFVFYDLMQWQIGSCSLKEIAVCMACPIVAKHNERDTLIIYGGSVHFSKDRIIIDGKNVFGLLVKLTETGWQFFEKSYYLTSVSQEHGILEGDSEMLNQFSIGDLVGIIPVHSCLTADLMKSYQTIDGKIISRL